jgi:hypothetical protein
MDDWTVTAMWLVVFSSLVLVGACVVLHYEVLSACHRHLHAISHRQRPRTLILISVVLVVHVVEIWLFGIGYYVLSSDTGFGTLQGLRTPTLRDLGYFSAMTYTTVGFGDVIPVGPIRFLAAVEAVTGLVMIAWSASYTFLEMQRHWASR